MPSLLRYNRVIFVCVLCWLVAVDGFQKRNELHAGRPLLTTPGAGTRALLVTSLCPTDTLPISPMIAHWQRMLSGSSSTLVNTKVLDNRPPWMKVHRSNASAAELHNLQSQQGIEVETVNYERFDDAEFMARYINLLDSGWDEASLRQVMDEASKRGIWQHPMHDRDSQTKVYASNTLAMMHFFEACQHEELADVCIWLDPDIFLYRATYSAVDLASDVFGKHAQLVAAQLPSGASAEPLQTDNDMLCRVMPVGLLSSRYFMVNRSRLISSFPLSLELDAFRLGGFEMVFTSWLNAHHAGGGMMCGGEIYAQHPPSVQSLPHNCDQAAQFLSLGTSGPICGSNITFDRLLDQLAQSAGRQNLTAGAALTASIPSATWNKSIGQEELIRRMESGLFVRASDADWVDDMAPSADRISQGFAW
eukprot:TRINITY_DN32668_c0_g1_i1.p1 TRINITY_DN32668_c0_g1~~TRINITY_DN32668_c0_g1_i1.p1  ORF type:complete len:420 (-),score=43.94 TRINITY_DN32668_c0_g1_i1:183-1442(-)